MYKKWQIEKYNARIGILVVKFIDSFSSSLLLVISLVFTKKFPSNLIHEELLLLLKPVYNSGQAFARIGMAKEAADAASQAKDGELLGRLKLTFAQNAAASSLFDTLRDRLSFQGVS